MSKLRSINTKIWSDTWFEELTVSQKLLFIYLITNNKTNMLGVYEISIKKISFETGINIDTIKKSIKTFDKVGKMRYSNNRVILINYLKHQNYNFNMMKSAIEIYNFLPDNLKIVGINRLDKSREAFETLCNGFGMVRKDEYELEVLESEVLEEEEEEEPKKKTKVFTPPLEDDFLRYAVDLFPTREEYFKNKQLLKNQFKGWEANGWVNGRTEKPIKVWQTTLGNVVKYMIKK